MKVFHAGITSPFYSSEAITQSFKEVFGDVYYFNWQEHRYLLGVEGMRNELRVQALVYEPDVIFLHFNHTSEVLRYEDYEKLKEIATVVTYTEDVREDISHFEKIAPVVDWMIFTNIDDVETLAAKGINNASYLPVSYNNIWYKPQPKTEKYYGDIVFIGNNYTNTNLNFPNSKQRQEMIAALKKEFGDKFQAYGLGQKNQMLNPQQAVECYNNTKIAITHNNFTRKGYQSDRGLNSMGCRCYTLMQNFKGIQEQFGEHGWTDINDIIGHCHFLLQNDDVRTGIAYNQNATTRRYHGWNNRSQSIKNLING